LTHSVVYKTGIFQSMRAHNCDVLKQNNPVRQTDCSVYNGVMTVLLCVSVGAVHVADSMNRDDAGYIEALEHETRVLQKRVVACRSRAMIVTVFDVT